MTRPKPPIMLEPQEALAHLLLAGKTQGHYKLDKKLQKKQRATHYIDYNKVSQVKKECEPDGIYVADDGREAIVDMQASLHHQLNRLLTPYLMNRLQTIKALEPRVQFTMYVKCGGDGSSGHGNYQFPGEYTNMYINVYCLFVLGLGQKYK